MNSAIQLFRKEQDDYANLEIWKACNTYMFEGLNVYFADAYKDYKFGALLYDKQYSQLTRVLARDLFIASYDALFRSLPRAGTYENLIAIVKAIFGVNSTVLFTEPAPGQINVAITQTASDFFNWATKPDADQLITSGGDNLVFLVMIREIFLDEVINLFRQVLIPAGIFFTISITHIEG
jgi:hypothetical protein